MKNIIVFGGDGFLGWPLSLKLKSLGHNVLIVDDFSRRWYDQLFGMNSLVPIASCEDRQQVSGIKFEKISVDQSFDAITRLFAQFKPDVCFHFAQQRSAPVSMHSSQSRISTITRNNASTINILEAIRTHSPNTKLVHMGTMGVYGYDSATEIKEGYDDQGKLLPMNPGSVYHLTKCHDQLTFQFYKKTYGLDIVDLHQGIVWGSQTTETIQDDRMLNRYDYDSMYGTVFNRFIAQYLKGLPLTVYGDGTQKRAFVHIEDSVKSCVESMSLESTQRVNIANQFSELLTVEQVADYIISTKHCKQHPGILNIKNPRIESSSDFLAKNDYWKNIVKIDPAKINKKTILDEMKVAKKYIYRYDTALTMPNSNW